VGGLNSIIIWNWSDMVDPGPVKVAQWGV